ncbi:MAG: PfkB family carbohydrate kinase [Acidimicrobiales bacterium]
MRPPPDGPAFVPHAGGGPFNTAIALGRLETPVGYLGRLSTDGFGRLLRQGLVDNHVDLRLAVDTAAPTTLALVTLSDAGEASYSFYTEGTAGCGLGREQLPDRLPDDVEAIHLGSLGIVLEPGASGLEALVERERGRRLVSLDPNVRPAIIPEALAFAGRVAAVTCGRAGADPPHLAELAP